MRKPRHNATNLLPALRLAAELRGKMLEQDITDNGGAIHSAERIVNILGVHLKYPNLSHSNNIKDYPGAEFSEGALSAYKRGERVFIEHVLPLRAFTRNVIAEIENDKTDKELLEYINKNYRLVLLTADETSRLNKINRTKIQSDRLGQAAIKTTFNK